MEFEKIVSTILEKSGKTDVSKATVTMLAKLLPVADGDEPDEEYFDKMVNAVKSVQGNVNNVMSAKVTEQVNAKVSEELSKRRKKPKDDESEKLESGDDMPKWAKEMRDTLRSLTEERQREKAERSKKELLESVKKRLEEKFDEGGLKLNGFFAKSALSKLDIPEKDADVKALADEAERIYNMDLKEAGISIDSPHAGGNSGGSGSKGDDEHAFDDVAKVVSRFRPKQD